MPQTRPLHGLLDQLIDQFASAVAARAQQIFSQNAPKGARAGARMCPYPGCPNPGAGPRNRWFCREHAKSVPVREQKRLLAERANASGAELVISGRRSSPMKGRKLDMHCRVEGCKNPSRGPRFGFMCAKHSKDLTPKQQREAREKWKASHAKKAA